MIGIKELTKYIDSLCDVLDEGSDKSCMPDIPVNIGPTRIEKIRDRDMFTLNCLQILLARAEKEYEEYKEVYGVKEHDHFENKITVLKKNISEIQLKYPDFVDGLKSTKADQVFVDHLFDYPDTDIKKKPNFISTLLNNVNKYRQETREAQIDAIKAANEARERQ
jgi:hypothetical protein